MHFLICHGLIQPMKLIYRQSLSYSIRSHSWSLNLHEFKAHCTCSPSKHNYCLEKLKRLLNKIMNSIWKTFALSLNSSKRREKVLLFQEGWLVLKLFSRTGRSSDHCPLCFRQEKQSCTVFMHQKCEDSRNKFSSSATMLALCECCQCCSVTAWARVFTP